MSYEVKCSICKRMIGLYGLAKHSKMHKRELGENCYKKQYKKDRELKFPSKKVTYNCNTCLNCSKIFGSKKILYCSCGALCSMDCLNNWHHPKEEEDL